MKGSVVQEWMAELSWKQQTVVLLALRGCDGVRKEDPSKVLVRYLRRIVLCNAAPAGQFMEERVNWRAALKQIAGELDPYPMHWLMHFIHAVEIIGYKHPDQTTAAEMGEVYRTLVDALHLDTESETRLDERLKDEVN